MRVPDIADWSREQPLGRPAGRAAEAAAVGVVVIGRNEGERLKRCLGSLAGRAPLVYVDSASSDQSVAFARGMGLEVVALAAPPFTAARARNAGLARLLDIAPETALVQFVDGDCEIDAAWLDAAAQFLAERADVGVVCGTLREREPARSVYNWMCDREWSGPAGEISACGGIAMIRAEALRKAGAYREDVIAAEDDELCLRIRRAGFRIWRLPEAMGLHDAAMTGFAQWWRRATRTGYAYAQGAQLHGGSAERHFVAQLRRIWLWGVALPAVLIGLAIAVWPAGLVALLIYPAQFLRLVLKERGTLRERAALSFFHIMARFAEAVGLAKFWRDRLLKRPGVIIEHK